MKFESTGPELEIAAHSLESALAAQKGGADRIELCSTLPTGGLTPEGGLIDVVLRQLTIPVHVLVRPRLGNFNYDDFEFQTVLACIQDLKAKGVDGVVVGALTQDYLIDKEKVRKIREIADPLKLTFHRAIDHCRDIFDALDFLEDQGFDKLLTSGCAKTAELGKQVIASMVDHVASYNLEIMAGAGINSSNIGALAAFTKCNHYHTSAKRKIGISCEDHIGLTSVFGHKIDYKWESDVTEVTAIKKELSTRF